VYRLHFITLFDDDDDESAMWMNWKCWNRPFLE